MKTARLTSEHLNFRIDLEGAPWQRYFTMDLLPDNRSLEMAVLVAEKSAAQNWYPPKIVSYRFAHATRPRGQFRSHRAYVEITECAI